MSIDLDALLAAIAQAAPRCGAVRVVAVDGGAASGKSTLATRLAAALSAEVVRTDDLLDGWGDQFTFWPRLRDGVLRPLASGRPGRYRRYDWIAGAFADEVIVPVPNTLVVEGVSAIAACASWLSLGIFLDVDRAVREQRWTERDGPPQPEWLRWLDDEDRFFAAHTLPPGTLNYPRSNSTTSGR